MAEKNSKKKKKSKSKKKSKGSKSKKSKKKSKKKKKSKSKKKKGSKKKDFTPSDHDLVPKHEKLSDKQKKELYKKYKIDFKELPKILISDPALKELDVEEGDVLKITRESRVAGEAEYYRGVVDE